MQRKAKARAGLLQKRCLLQSLKNTLHVVLNV